MKSKSVGPQGNKHGDDQSGIGGKRVLHGGSSSTTGSSSKYNRHEYPGASTPSVALPIF